MEPTYKILVVEVEQDLGTGRVAIEAWIRAQGS